MKETEIQNSILEYLHYKNIFAWRNNSGAVFDPTSQVFRAKGRWDLNGVPDIVGILPDGRFLGIEVKKTAKSKVSADQLSFIKMATTRNAVCFVAWDLKGVREGLKHVV